ncbi:hypothetical protein LTR49_027079 [Elasticomyces elasticus]|nr:hypothetical protein LTR49_027079 [Elasticomyces elasticus]
MKKLSGKIYFPLIMVGFGTVVCCISAVKNDAGLLAARFFLGGTSADGYNPWRLDSPRYPSQQHRKAPQSTPTTMTSKPSIRSQGARQQPAQTPKVTTTSGSTKDIMDKVESPPESLVEESDGAQTAAERVFGILELFEMIFDLVDSVDIIRWRGVSKCIHESISGSRTLLERLCLRPVVSAGSVRHVPVTPSSIKLEISHECGLACPHVAGSVEVLALEPTEGSSKMWKQMYISSRRSRLCASRTSMVATS